SAQKVVVYSVEGFGKSSMAATFPDPLFIDTEGSTKKLNVRRLPKPTSYQMMCGEINAVIAGRYRVKTLVIDTADWAETLIVNYLCDKHGKDGIEGFGYGNGFTYLNEEMNRFLMLLDRVIDVGVNVVLLAHATIRKFDQPDEMGSYDRYELKLGKKTTAQTAPLIKEWADMVLFGNYKTMSVAVDDKGKKHKAQGNQKVLHTIHHPCWDAKNRDGLPAEIQFDYTYNAIAHCIPNDMGLPGQESLTPNTVPSTTNVVPIQQAEVTQQPPVVGNPEVQQKIDETIQAMEATQPQLTEMVATDNQLSEDLYQGLPQALIDLMRPSNVTIEEIQNVVVARGHFPAGTPITNYPEDYINGVLISAWSQVLPEIEKRRNQIPFD
ncbi:MAG: ATP-binding protein, partial [Coprobacillaceae bacterium]